MILITGATGHIGNVLARQLLARGESVRALVRPGSGASALQDLDLERFPGDVLDPDSLVHAMQGIDLVYHLAARVSLAPGPDPETERVNLEGTGNLIAAARRAGIRRLVYASSIYALRLPAKGIVDESLPFDPAHARGAYDRSKASASLEVQRAAANGLETVIVCPTAVTGPFDFHGSESGRGVRYNMGRGIKFYIDGAYDFVDVRDVARGLILAAEKGLPGETYILGGERLTVREVAETVWQASGGWCYGVRIPLWLAYLAAEVLPAIAELTGSHPLVTPYALDALQSNSNISHARAQRELGYRPHPARQALRDAVTWFQTIEGIQATPFPAETQIEATT
ncbi:MAG: NAD-dependent epimerase/dehydratase family protein [Anaerolineales bacterium]|nr:NAD-dependent epimerase/dehydratase family protein [Anaerolineales bacterium]